MPFTTISGRSIFYTINEPSSTTSPLSTLLLIHGLGSTSSFYQTVIPFIVDDCSARCIAIDTPGSGLSSLPASAQSISSIADDAVGLLRALKIAEKVIVVGHSMGGIVASYIGATHPDLVKGVILIGPVNPSPTIALAFHKRIEVVEKYGLENLANTIPNAAVGSKATTLEKAFIRTLILNTSPAGYVSLCKVIAQAEPPDYAAIKTPLQIIAGKEDMTAPVSASEAILSAYGTKKEKKKLEMLNGVGHWHCIEAPEEVAALIKKFVGELD